MSNFFNQRVKTEKSLKREIKAAYKRVANKYIKRLATVNPDTLTYEYLRQSARYLEKEYKQLTRELNNTVEKNIKKTVEGYTQSQLELYTSLCPEISKSWEDMFVRINSIVLNQIVSGNMYKDKIKLSSRLWGNNKETIKTINLILTDGFTSKKNSKDIAKDLEVFVNPDYLKEYELFTIHPKSKNKIDFSAYRLANTYINHAYQTATKECAKHNPFVETITWVSGTDGRVCDICASRDGQQFKKNEVPLDHPLGRCTLITDVGDLDQIAKELKDWVNGKPNTGLDDWFKAYDVNVNKVV